MTTTWKTEWKKLLWGVVIFAACFAMPVDWPRFSHAVFEALALTKWYAQEHVLLCLIPAFFIAGAIGVFVSQASVMKYLGPKAPKVLAYGVASVSGTILAVCSCTVLPLFAGIWRMGAGLGPATAFLYSGPAINVLAIILTARILGLEIGIARAVGAIVFSVVIGLAMHLIYRKEETAKADAAMAMPEAEVDRPLWQNILYFGAMVGVLVFANWGKPDVSSGFWHAVWSGKWMITSFFAIVLAVILVAWFGLSWRKVAGVGAATVAAWLVSVFWIAPAVHGSTGGHHLPWEAMIPFAVAVVGLSVILAGRRDPSGEWFNQTWTFTKQITPLLLFGVLVAGFLLGRPLGVGQLLRGVCWCVHVFRDVDGGADPAGSDGRGHGQGARAGASAGRPGVESAQHAGDSQHHGDAEDRRVCVAGGGDGDDLRNGFRCAAVVEDGR